MNPRAVCVAAVDLGAASGRVLSGRIGPDTLDLTEVARFANAPVRVAGTLHWDVLRLYQNILEGLRAAGGSIASVGVDSWGVDFGLLDPDGRMLANPVHYRDERTDGVMARVLDTVSPVDIYRATGIQFLPFNTVYQLLAITDTAQYGTAATLLLIPDLMTYWFTGEAGVEVTNASTTQLLDPRTGQWATDLMARVGIREDLFPTIRRPGDVIGELLPQVRATTGLPAGVRAVAVGSHDTASAVVGVPATNERFAYISCGTWSLVGVELDQPVLTEDSRIANFTNEVGVDGTIRYLRNVMGLWLLQECQRVWHDRGFGTDLDELLRAAADLAPFAAIIDPDDPAFLHPGDMPARIADACRRLGQPVPSNPPALVRCIVDSLALAHRQALYDAQRLSGRTVDVIHIVGGGARNELLCQLTADACGLSVEAGPVEAGAIGNALVQARTLGAVGPDLPALRALVRSTQRIRRYEPASDRAADAAVAAARLSDIR